MADESSRVVMVEIMGQRYPIKSALDLAAECAPNAPIERARVAASKLDEAKR